MIKTNVKWYMLAIVILGKSIPKSIMYFQDEIFLNLFTETVIQHTNKQHGTPIDNMAKHIKKMMPHQQTI